MSYVRDPTKPFVISGDESRGEGWAAEERDIVLDAWSLPMQLPLRVHETHERRHRYVFRVKFFRFGRDEVLFGDQYEPLFWMNEEGEVLGVVSWSYFCQWITRRRMGAEPVYFPHPLLRDGTWFWKSPVVEGEVDFEDEEPKKSSRVECEDAEYEETNE
jgi:hypothetical protein